MRRRVWLTAVGLVFFLLLAAETELVAVGQARPGHRCRIPHLTGLVVSAAQSLATKAGCALRTEGASIESASVQTVRRQIPKPGKHGRAVTIWVNPLCETSAAIGPPSGEPLLTKGPTELVSGLYLDGGPLMPRSAPNCDSLSGTPGAGTITVINPMTGIAVASQGVTSGHLATIPLPPGSYKLEGTFADTTINGQPEQSFPTTVQIPAGETVRQDVVMGIP